MSELDPKAHLKGMLARIKGLVANDLNAIPVEKRNVSPGGAGRTPLNIVAECAHVNQRCSQYLKTLVPPDRLSPEEREAHLNSDDAKWGETTEFPFGRPMTLFGIAELPSVHLMYHDGQLNYIQTLYDDTEVHW
ncbi:MAG: hypothetical protein NT023_11855 [Armatimonadetes bacterium]|nr:hypothetical protein [Armatimonadota bacterium]